MIEVLSYRFQECLGPFTILLVKGSSETGLFGYLYNPAFRSLLFWKYKTYDDYHFFQNVENLI